MSAIRRICLFGGPGVGKSRLSAKLFAELFEYDVDLVVEYIKDWVYEGRKPVELDQYYVLTKQMRREEIKLRGVQAIITDSPLLLAPAYAAYYGHTTLVEPLLCFLRVFEERHPSLNILIERSVPYKTAGRYHSEEQARDFDAHLESFLAEHLTSPLHRFKLFEDGVSKFPELFSFVASHLRKDEE